MENLLDYLFLFRRVVFLAAVFLFAVFLFAGAFFAAAFLLLFTAIVLIYFYPANGRLPTNQLRYLLT